MTWAQIRENACLVYARKRNGYFYIRSDIALVKYVTLGPRILKARTARVLDKCVITIVLEYLMYY